MVQRLQLQSLLEQFVPNVYFQPPESIALKYPCIVYRRDFAYKSYADNGTHAFAWRYEVTVIDRDPDSEIPGSVGALPMCAFNRHFAADDLNHDVFNLYWKGP